MKNKIKYKKYLIQSFVIMLSFSALFTFVNLIEYQRYQYHFNHKISGIIEVIETQYPKIEKSKIVEILQSENGQRDILQEYGYDLNHDTFVSENMKVNQIYTFIEVCLFLIGGLLIGLLFHHYNQKKDREIQSIIKCIEDINHKNYDLHIDEMSEDQLSILKNEIYKTTIILKEQAENSLKDKRNLKDSLQDISHQLKTPLTSINIMLDNILDDLDMDSTTRNYFIRCIKRELTNINFLVQSILKLSKLESNTIDFMKDNYAIERIVNEAIKNISNLCDLKNIEIKVINECERKICCDFRWEVEAITNILKNAVEYSKNGDKVWIECSENNVYSQIKIIDYGVGMDEEDLNNLFKRFYKGKGASKDSFGIGLALAKAIIENDRGRVEVDSSKGKGTTFKIKYFI